MHRQEDLGREQEVAVVTGASSGIGESLVRLLARRGARVVMVARRGDRLNAIASTLEADGLSTVVREADLADPTVPEQLIRQVDEEFGRLDLLINNAGFGRQTFFESQDWGEVERMFRVNVMSLMALSRAAIPVMRRRGRGSIVNIASVGGLVAHPLNVAYCATKHAVVGFSKSLQLELYGTGIHVVVVCPGGTRTEFFDMAEDRLPFDPALERFLVSPEAVARAILRVTHSRRPQHYPSWGAAFLVWADKWLPPISRLGNLRYRDRVLGRLDRG